MNQGTKIEEIFSIALSCGLLTKLRTEQRNVWTEILLNCSYIPYLYTNASIDYQWAYQLGHGGDWKDISLIVYLDSKAVAVWPLSIAHKEGKNILSSHGIPVMPPLFANCCSKAAQKHIIRCCLLLANTIAGAFELNFWESAESFNDSIGLSSWHSEALKLGATINIQHELFVNLKPNMVEIKSNFRKSYKSLISEGVRTWSIGVLDAYNESTWKEFKELHLRIAGRSTRSEETWALHHQDIQDQNAFLVYLRNMNGEMIGGGFFNFTRDEGLYAVAAYDRSLFDKPLGHVVQYKAIEILKSKGVRWQKLGRRPYQFEMPTPTEKEISIGKFKQGFASHVFPQFRLMHKVNN